MICDHIDALVGDRLTARKAADICARNGYKVTGVVLTQESGQACIVNMSAVRWLSWPNELHNLMFPSAENASARSLQARIETLIAAFKVEREGLVGERDELAAQCSELKAQCSEVAK